LLLENTRFHPEEEKRMTLRWHGSWLKWPIFLSTMLLARPTGPMLLLKGWPSLARSGRLPARKEIRYLGRRSQIQSGLLWLSLGGAKISDKIGVIRNLLNKADQVLIGGGMANTFFKAQGYPVADSLVEDEALDTARELLQGTTNKLRLPVDVVIGDRFEADAESKVMSMGPVPDGWRILDIGPETISAYGKTIAGAGTVVWNGPMGVFEFPRFARGTFELAKAVANSDALTIVGGGDSVAAIQESGMADRITHISTGGGASLEMLEGLELPGVAALQDKRQ
jgi:phosphoglycerate kinase